MIPAWLTWGAIKRLWPLGAGLGLLLALFLLVRCADRAQDKAVTSAHDAGRSAQQADDLHETLNRTEKANDAAKTIGSDDIARHNQCVRYSRTPENCD